MPSIISKLKAKLLTSGLQQSNTALYEIINQLLGAFESLDARVSNGNSGSEASDSDILTWSNESTDLPNSRELLAGVGIQFDDSVFGERTVTNELSDETILTELDETAVMPNSRRLVAGTNITFDDSVANIRTVNVSTPTANEIRDLGYWLPLVAVVGIDAEMVLTDTGNPIAVWTPTP